MVFIDNLPRAAVHANWISSYLVKVASLTRNPYIRVET